jgi:hypothetical protein
MDKPKSILHILIWLVLILIFFAFSCKSAQPPVAVPYGSVTSVQGDWVQVTYEVVNKDPGSLITAWWYCPGHRFARRDRWPDSTKYPLSP